MASSAPRLAGLLLAAGGSRRLGRPKQLLVHRGRTLVEAAADAALAVCDDAVVVVLGAFQREVEAKLASREIVIAANSQWRDGIGTSLAAGVARLPASCDGVLVLLCDQPRVSQDELRALVAAWRPAPARIVAAAYGDGAGVPAIFPRRCFAALGALRGDRGARALIEAAGDDVVRVALPDAAFDVDDAIAAAALEP
jgi:CTP:molybdopterin cytidylyltransferase MocA